MAFLISSLSLGLTAIPHLLSFIIFPVLPLLLAIIGFPAAIASNSLLGGPAISLFRSALLYIAITTSEAFV